MVKKLKKSAVKSLLGCFLILFIAGNSLFVIDMEPFFLGYFTLIGDPSLKYLHDFDVIFLDSGVFFGSMLLTSILMSRYQAKLKLYILLGLFFELAAIVAFFVSNNYRLLAIAFTSLYSFGSGTLHLVCLQILWEYFINHRGEVCGFVFFSSWLGNFIMTVLCRLISNPKNDPMVEKGFDQKV